MVVERMERHQVALYVGAIAVGAVLGLLVPVSGSLVDPVLGALLYVTFLGVPARDLVGSLRAGRFVGAVLAVNLVAAPLVVVATAGFLPADDTVRTAVLLVLLAPCVDYVIVFCGLAGGSAGRLLALTPLLLLAQLALLPVVLVGAVPTEPFVRAFLTLIVLPLAAAWLTQAWAARRRAGARFAAAAGTTMVPLMVATLLVVVASQVPAVAAARGTVAAVVPFYVGFLLVMGPLGLLVARLFRLDRPDAVAVAFTGATRNSLVVLPLALTLPAGAGAVVVAQTLVEVVGMVVYVRVLGRRR